MLGQGGGRDTLGLSADSDGAQSNPAQGMGAVAGTAGAGCALARFVARLSQLRASAPLDGLSALHPGHTLGQLGARASHFTELAARELSSGEVGRAVVGCSVHNAVGALALLPVMG